MRILVHKTKQVRYPDDSNSIRKHQPKRILQIYKGETEMKEKQISICGYTAYVHFQYNKEGKNLIIRIPFLKLTKKERLVQELKRWKGR
jgi:hypothetical protein